MEKIKRKNKKGFTLIEVLVVMGIIGILASMTLASLGNARLSARDAARKASLRSIRTALDSYYVDYGYYPGGYGDPFCNECTSGYISGSAVGTAKYDNLLAALDPYIEGALPFDPVDSDGQRFYYDARHGCGGQPSGAFLFVPALENGSGNVGSLCTSWGNEGMGGLGTQNTWMIQLYN